MIRMKQLLFLTTVIITININAQNVGIGTLTPNYPLTVIPDNNGNGIVLENNTVKVGFYNNATSGGILKTLSNHPFFITTNNNSSPAITLATDRNVGIGLGANMPEYKLDLYGRMRLRHNSSNNQTAGIWFDGTTMEARSFFGTLNDDHVGIYGNGGAGWNFVMNVENGNTGIGTSAPTAKLDVNGTIRLRDGYPKTGSVLTSTDVNGNTTWQAPVAFRAWGTAAVADSFPIPANTWTRWLFSITTQYNSGIHYQPWATQFIAPLKGIYHFDANTWTSTGSGKLAGIALRGTRNGVPMTLLYKFQNFGGVTISGTQYDQRTDVDASFSTEVLLEAGDIVWVEVYSSINTYARNYSSNYFSGVLVARL